MKIRSLHAQVNIALIVLAITLLTQLYIAKNSLHLLSNNQTKLIDTYDNVSLIYELERDVIDLQRNLLVYKETASDSSIHRFSTVLDSIQFKIKILSQNIESGKAKQINPDMFERMVEHIRDYEENFASVIHARSRQIEAIEHINEELEFVFKDIKNKNNKLKNNAEIKVLFVEVRQSIYSYFNKLDPAGSETFNNKIDSLISLMNQDVVMTSYIVLKDIKQDFRRLIQLNRGYLYLSNVVMAGSANEFLFLTKKIREDSIQYQHEIDLEASKSSDRIQNQFSIVSVVSILIVIVIAIFFSNRLLTPIKAMTSVFRTLSKGEEFEVDGIPYVNRQDEIGELARSAEVFHQNNILTKDLLVQSQDMIANQEVLNIQLEQEKEKAESAAESKSMFLANMSHEIRTPMNGIVGLVDLLKKTPLQEKQKNYLDRIAYSGQIMMNVINDILDFSKIEAGKMEIEQVEFDINSVIENVISSMSVRVKDKCLDFRVWVSNQVPRNLIGDPLRISQILLNLCSNSIKFTDKGSIYIYFDYEGNTLKFSVTDTGIGMSEEQLSTIFESFTQADGSISRKYGGTGLGLSIVDQLASLMGGQVHVTSEINQGTNIDVSIKCEPKDANIKALDIELPNVCYIPKDKVSDWIASLYTFQMDKLKIIKEKENLLPSINNTDSDFLIFEGLKSLGIKEIESLSENGKVLGCILDSNENKQKNEINKISDLKLFQHPFSPRQCEQYFKSLLGEEAKTEAQPIESDLDIQFSGHLLLVEDNEINQIVAGDMLETLGLSYEVAENGVEAIEMITNNSYDLILMDVQMPKMDGYTATQKLRELGFNDLVICGLSANALKDDLDKAKQAGMSDYLTKPLVIEELQKVLQKYL